jgi:small subunit ribosomal protein S1
MDIGKKVKSQKSKVKSKQSRKTGRNSNPQTMEELLKLEKYKIPTFTLGEYIEGKLVSIHPKEVLVDIGGKANAVVGHKELEDIRDVFKDYKVGDKVIGRVISEENREGRVVISLIKFAYDNRWGKLKKAYKKGKKIEVLVRDAVGGGLLVDYSGVRGYIPPSHIDPEFRENPGRLRGRTIEVKILEIGREQNRFVVSQKLVTRKEEIAVREKFLKGIKIGSVLEAEVEGIVPFGLFVRIPTNEEIDGEKVDIEGLVHISEIAWEKVEDPSEYYAEGDKVKVKVLEKGSRNDKLNLSIKQTIDDPWVKVKSKFKKGDMVKGKVVRDSAYGVFVELEKGIEGLAHISNIPAGAEPKEGEKVTVQIESIDEKERRIALSIIPTEKPVMYR